MKKEFGRSMIEMLGVLAIIGVLSIVAVSALRTAFIKHDANQIMEDVKLAVFFVQEGLFDKMSSEEEVPILESFNLKQLTHLTHIKKATRHLQ